MKKWTVAVAAVSALAIAVLVASSTSTPRMAAVQIINEGTTPDAATFEPGTVTVQRGTTVVWTNADASAHTVTSKDPAGVFDSGVMGPNGEFEFKFETAGVFAYYCKIHPVMVGSVIVQ